MKKNALIIILLFTAASGWLYSMRLYSALLSSFDVRRSQRTYSELLKDFAFDDYAAGLKRVEELTTNSTTWKESVRTPLAAMWVRVSAAPEVWYAGRRPTAHIDQRVLLNSLCDAVRHELLSTRTLNTCAVMPVIDQLFFDPSSRERACILLAIGATRVPRGRTASDIDAVRQLRTLSQEARKQVPTDTLLLSLAATHDYEGLMRFAEEFASSAAFAQAPTALRGQVGFYRMFAYVGLGQPDKARALAHQLAEAKDSSCTQDLILLKRIAKLDELTTDSIGRIFRELFGRHPYRTGFQLQPDALLEMP